MKKSGAGDDFWNTYLDTGPSASASSSQLGTTAEKANPEKKRTKSAEEGRRTPEEETKIKQDGKSTVEECGPKDDASWGMSGGAWGTWSFSGFSFVSEAVAGSETKGTESKQSEKDMDVKKIEKIEVEAKKSYQKDKSKRGSRPSLTRSGSEKEVDVQKWVDSHDTGKLPDEMEKANEFELDNVTSTENLVDPKYDDEDNVFPSADEVDILIPKELPTTYHVTKDTSPESGLESPLESKTDGSIESKVAESLSEPSAADLKTKCDDIVVSVPKVQDPLPKDDLAVEASDGCDNHTHDSKECVIENIPERLRRPLLIQVDDRYGLAQTKEEATFKSEVTETESVTSSDMNESVVVVKPDFGAVSSNPMESTGLWEDADLEVPADMLVSVDDIEEDVMASLDVADAGKGDAVPEISTSRLEVTEGKNEEAPEGEMARSVMGSTGLWEDADLEVPADMLGSVDDVEEEVIASLDVTDTGKGDAVPEISTSRVEVTEEKNEEVPEGEMARSVMGSTGLWEDADLKVPADMLGSVDDIEEVIASVDVTDSGKGDAVPEISTKRTEDTEGKIEEPPEGEMAISEIGVAEQSSATAEVESTDVDKDITTDLKHMPLPVSSYPREMEDTASHASTDTITESAEFPPDTQNIEETVPGQVTDASDQITGCDVEESVMLGEKSDSKELINSSDSATSSSGKLSQDMNTSRDTETDVSTETLREGECDESEESCDQEEDTKTTVEGKMEESTISMASSVSSGSFVKCMLEEAMAEPEIKHEDVESHSTSSDRSSDMVKIDSGHTSGDEIDTTTSSDIEIISTPTSNGDRLDRPFDLSPLRHALSRTVRRVSPPHGQTHKRTDSNSSSSGHSKGSDLEQLSPGREYAAKGRERTKSGGDRGRLQKLMGPDAGIY
jgi:hypothetical protein